MKQFAAIILLSILAAIVYGVIHDQVTAHICVEYFTIGHPPVMGGASDPILLGLLWGVIATWWFGLILGVLLALSARAGSWPKLAAGGLIRPLASMLLILAGFAALAGCVGYVAASRGWFTLTEPLAWDVPVNRHVAFLTDLWVHLASYIGGAIGGIALCIITLKRRCRSGKRLQGSGRDHAF